MDTLSLSLGNVSVIITKSGHGRQSPSSSKGELFLFLASSFGVRAKSPFFLTLTNLPKRAEGTFLPSVSQRARLLFSLFSKNRWLALWTWNPSNFRTAQMLQIRRSPTQRCMWNPRILYRMRHFRVLSGMPTKRMARQTGVRIIKDRISYISVWVVRSHTVYIFCWLIIWNSWFSFFSETQEKPNLFRGEHLKFVTLFEFNFRNA